MTVLLILGGWVGGDLVDVAARDPGPLYWTFALYNIGTILVFGTLAGILIHALVRIFSPKGEQH